MPSVWFIILVVAFSVLIAVLAIVLAEKIVFTNRVKRIKVGMTGKDVERATGRKVKVTNVNMDKNTYTAKISSPMRFFSYNLHFKDGRYQKRERSYRKR